MAKHKNQHFVPQCYLRQFSNDNTGKAVSLLHIKSRKLVQTASVNDQCAKPYLYGDDLEIEQALQGFEGEYARIFRHIVAHSNSPGKENLIKLRNFMILQASRTEAAIMKTKLLIEESQEVINKQFPGELPELESDIGNMMLMSLSIYTDLRKYLTDLKICLVKNKTQTQFITSDDPVVFTSMFHAKKQRTDRFGFVSTGAPVFLTAIP